MPDQHPLNSSVAEQLAEFSVGTTIDDIPEDVIAMAKVGILDCLGVTLAGSAKAASRKIQSYVRDIGGHPQSTVIGVALKTSAPSAALANGYAAHVLDFDDTQRSMISHPTATVLPAVLALGELLNVSGRKLLEAYLVGTEIACKIGRGVNPEHAKHWHGSGTLGTMGAAAGAMKIFDLDVSQSRAVLGFAASQAAGLRKNKGTSAKPFHVGNAARSGVVAAQLVHEGLAADDDIFEGQFGFGEVFCGADHYRPDLIVTNFGDPFEILHPGLDIKHYPCCSGGLTAIDATLALVNEHDLKPDDVEGIDCGVSYTTPLNMIHPVPKTGLEAMFSMGFCVCVALVDRLVGVQQFTDEKVAEATIQDLMKKFNLYIRDDLKGVESSASNESTVTRRTHEGRTLSKTVERDKGSSDNPLSKDELRDKFISCATTVLPEARATHCLEMIENLEMLEDARQLGESMAIG